MPRQWFWLVMVAAGGALVVFGGVKMHAVGSVGLTRMGRGVRARVEVSLREKRGSALDLEVGGDLAGLSAGSVRYLTRKDLEALPQVSYAVEEDANFSGTVRVRGV